MGWGWGWVFSWLVLGGGGGARGWGVGGGLPACLPELLAPAGRCAGPARRQLPPGAATNPQLPRSAPSFVTSSHQCATLPQDGAACACLQVEQGGGDPSQIEALRRKSELSQEAAGIKRRMRESQLSRWVLPWEGSAQERGRAGGAGRLVVARWCGEQVGACPGCGGQRPWVHLPQVAAYWEDQVRDLCPSSRHVALWCRLLAGPPCARPLLVWAYSLVSDRTGLQHRLFPKPHAPAAAASAALQLQAGEPPAQRRAAQAGLH